MKTHSLKHSTTFMLDGVAPYSFLLSVHKPAGWPLLTPFEVFEDDTLWTVMRYSGKLFGVKLRSTGILDKPSVSCVVFSEDKLRAEEKEDLRKTMRWVLSLDEDVKPFYALAKRDRLVRMLVEDLYGMRSTNDPNLFSALILAVCLQMAPMSRSNQMMQLLIKKYRESVGFDGKHVLSWPSAEAIATASVEELQRECKLGYRAKVLHGIAEELVKGFPTAQELEGMSAVEAKAKLMELKGIGEYSAEIVSPHEGFPLDVWSAKIFSLLMTGKMPKAPRDGVPKLKRMAEKRWGEWIGYVFVYVLQDLDNLSRKMKLNVANL
jgi:DNA-3-methyladenine glycosylase II